MDIHVCPNAGLLLSECAPVQHQGSPQCPHNWSSIVAAISTARLTYSSPALLCSMSGSFSTTYNLQRVHDTGSIKVTTIPPAKAPLPNVFKLQTKGFLMETFPANTCTSNCFVLHLEFVMGTHLVLQMKQNQLQITRATKPANCT